MNIFKASSFFIGSSSFLQVTWTTIKSGMSSKFGQIRPLTAELAALERLKKNPYTPQPLYNTIVRVQANFRVSYPNRVITRVKCIVI